MREKHFILNKKGIKLAAVVERPDKKGRFPGVILLHGFTGYKEEEQYTELAKLLLEKDIVSIRFDASGFGESGGTLEYDYRFSHYISDTEVVYDWFKNQDFVDFTRIGVMGQSLGGFQSLILTANHPEIKAVISVSSPNIFHGYGQSEEKDKKIEEWKNNGYTERISSRFGTLRIPLDYMLDAQKYKASDYANKIETPKLFIYGTDDVNVPVNEAKQVFENTSGVKEVYEVEGMDHYYKRNPELLAKVTKKIVEFIEKNI